MQADNRQPCYWETGYMASDSWLLVPVWRSWVSLPPFLGETKQPRLCCFLLSGSSSPVGVTVTPSFPASEECHQ